MVLWQGILIVLGCIAVGFLVGLGLLRVLRRKKEKGYPLSNKEAATVSTKDAEVPVAATSNNTITKSNGHEDPLEILLKNHKNGIVAENTKQPVVTANPGNVGIVNQKTEPVIKKEEKPAPHVMRWQELVTPGNPLMQDEYEKTRELPVVKEPAAVNQTSAPVAKEPAAVNQTSPPVAKEPAAVNQTSPPVAKEPVAVHQTSAPVAKEPAAVNQTSAPVAKEPAAVNQTSTPVVKEPAAVNQTGTPLAAEPAKAATISILEEPAIINQTTTPVKEKPKKAAKTPAPEKPETITQKHPPAVKDKKKDTKPPAPEPVIIKHEKDQKSTEPPQVQESADIEPKITPFPEKQAGVLKTDLIIEIEGNLAIAGRPISDKMVPFQTKCWDSKHGESDLFLNAHYQELIQLYVDIGLANNIVWLATEINHRSKELDESYIRLCSGIVENIKKVLA
jgi:hypothetical protein